MFGLSGHNSWRLSTTCKLWNTQHNFFVIRTFTFTTPTHVGVALLPLLNTTHGSHQSEGTYLKTKIKTCRAGSRRSVDVRSIRPTCSTDTVRGRRREKPLDFQQTVNHNHNTPRQACTRGGCMPTTLHILVPIGAPIPTPLLF